MPEGTETAVTSSVAATGAAPALPLASPSRVTSWLRAAFQPTLLPNHYAALHGLRVMAIVLVVQLHATAALARFRVIGFSTDSLWFGMDLFFFLSGFLIGSMLLAESSSGQRVNMLRFYLRRSFRIIPPYLIVLTVLAFGFSTPEQRKHLWLEYFYLTNYMKPTPKVGVMPWAWSLAVEEHFYLLVPLLVLTLRALRSPRAQLLLLFVLWLSAIPVRFFRYVTDGPWTGERMMDVIYVQSHLRYDILIAGIFAACVQYYYRDALVRWLRDGRGSYVLGGLSGFFFVLIMVTQVIAIVYPSYSLLCWGTFTSLMYAPLVLLLVNHEQGWLTRQFSRRPFLYVATFGYGIYLIHIPVLWMIVLPLAAPIVYGYLPPPVVTWVSIVAATFGLSLLGGYLLHVAIEKPALKLRDTFSP
jgi:peptidoglycan/LPS O-acetylase OafA/YrhL